jgi:hypothetical protein
MSNNDKINALGSIKDWAIERQLYDLAIKARDVERSLLEISTDYIRVIKPIECLSNEQKEFLLSMSTLFKNTLRKEELREIKIILILT